MTTGKTRKMRPTLIARAAAIAGALCAMALVAWDDRTLVWQEGNFFEIGQFVEVTPLPAALSAHPASGPFDHSVDP